MTNRYLSASISNRGLRKRNEDACSSDNDRGIFLVADGMGGHHRGDVASTAFIETAMNFLSTPKNVTDYFDLLSRAVSAANDCIYRLSQTEEEGKPMGTTAVICILENNRYHVGWVGDSRAYLFRKGKLRQVTKDHSLVQNLVDQKVISEKEALTHPERNVITRAIGTDQQVETDFTYGELKKGDLIFLCTDGICGVLENKKIQKLLKEKKSLEEKTKNIIDSAMKAGSEDNATAILIEVL